MPRTPEIMKILYVYIFSKNKQNYFRISKCLVSISKEASLKCSFILATTHGCVYYNGQSND
jgi:hypothetical protein